MGKEKWMKDILTIPNALSLVRILLTIGFCITYFTEEKLAALVILVISGITDVLDGQIARKYHQISNFGKVLDPFADKLFTVSTAVCICISGLVPVWLLCIIILKELILIIGSLVLYRKVDAVIPSRWDGKATTVVFFITFIVALFCEALSVDLHLARVIVTSLLILATALAIFSVINYIIIAVRLYREQRQRS